MEDTYPHAAAQGKTDTSQEAAAKIKPVRRGLETDVMAMLDLVPAGLTTSELSKRILKPVSGIQPRTSELSAKGREHIIDSGKRRKNCYGNNEIVWVLNPERLV